MPKMTKLNLNDLNVKSFKTADKESVIKGGSMMTGCFNQNISLCCRLK